MVKSNAVPKFLLATDASQALTAPRVGYTSEVRQIQVDFIDVSMRGQVNKHFRLMLSFGYSVVDS